MVNGRRKVASAVLGLLAAAALPAEAANLYRYHNAQGVLVIDNTMPASAAFARPGPMSTATSVTVTG